MDIYLIILIIVLLLAIYYALEYSCDCQDQCSYVHSQSGKNYEWLIPEFGEVNYVTFEEPIGAEPRKYNDHWWQVHCKVINHDPDKLIEEHMKAFVNPGRPIRLLFYFKNGKVMEPTRRFYELEAEYFRKKRICNK